MSISSIQVEKHAIGGLIRNQEIFADVDQFVNPNDFYHEVHATIYCVIRDTLSKGQKIDKILLAQKIKDLGVSFKDDINIFNYIDSIAFTQITPKATFEACQKLMELRIRREIFETAEKIQSFVQSTGDKNISQIISLSDAMYNNKISAFNFDEAPRNIFEDAEFVIEKLGENPVTETGLITPHTEYNRMFGGYKNGNIYAIVSRSGEGKSSFLVDTSLKTGEINKVKVLYLDTEMEKFDVQLRMISSFTGVPVWYLETGNWRKNKEMEQLVRAAWPVIKKYEFFHYHVKNRPIDEVISIIRRWKLSKVGRENRALIVYDYIKLTGESIDKGWMETQAIGAKVDKLKKVAEEIHAPLLSAMQMNRSGENFGKKSADLTDDSSAISLSDRLLWFATGVGIFRRKTLDELAFSNNQFGTHKYINLKGRFQGKDAMGHMDYMKIQVEKDKHKYVRNYINYELNNFKVMEKGSLKHELDFRNQKFTLDDKKDETGDLI